VKIIPPENAALQKNSFQKCGTAESLLSEMRHCRKPPLRKAPQKAALLYINVALQEASFHDCHLAKMWHGRKPFLQKCGTAERHLSELQHYRKPPSRNKAQQKASMSKKL
jgi:hypothetical protein